MPDEITPRPGATMLPAAAAELPPVARFALREVRRALIDRPDSAYDVLSTAMVVLAERQMLITPGVAAGIASTAYVDGIRRAAELVAENTGNSLDANAQMLRRQAAAVESGKVTPRGEITQTDVADDGAARCRLCGCTEARACEGGCVWVPNDLMVDVCSACVPAGPDVVRMTWAQAVTLSPGVADGTPAEVPMRTPAGVPALLPLTDGERRRLGDLLTLQTPNAVPCRTQMCGLLDSDIRETLGTPPSLWVCVQVHGVDEPPRWWCSPWCATEAISAAGRQAAAADTAAAVRAAAAAGPATYAEELDERYGPGAGDEYAAQVGEAAREGLDAERVYDPAEWDDEANAEALAGDGVVYDASDFPADVDDADYPDDGGDGRG